MLHHKNLKIFPSASFDLHIVLLQNQHRHPLLYNNTDCFSKKH